MARFMVEQHVARLVDKVVRDELGQTSKAGGVEALAGVSNKVLFEVIAKQLGRPLQDHERVYARS